MAVVEERLSDRQREYRRYLSSPEWRERRKAALERADHRCQVCNGTDRLEVHHRTYERLGSELPADLTVLCREHHELFHFGPSLVARAAAKPKSKAPKKKQPVTTPEIAQRICDFLADGPKSTEEVAAHIGRTRGSTGGILGAMKQKKILAKAQGKNKDWRLRDRRRAR